MMHRWLVGTSSSDEPDAADNGIVSHHLDLRRHLKAPKTVTPRSRRRRRRSECKQHTAEPVTTLAGISDADCVFDPTHWLQFGAIAPPPSPECAAGLFEARQMEVHRLRLKLVSRKAGEQIRMRRSAIDSQCHVDPESTSVVTDEMRYFDCHVADCLVAKSQSHPARMEQEWGVELAQRRRKLIHTSSWQFCAHCNEPKRMRRGVRFEFIATTHAACDKIDAMDCSLKPRALRLSNVISKVHAGRYAGMGMDALD